MCLFFIVFQDKEKESTQQMGILQEVRISFFLSCPGGLGRPGPSPGPGPSLVPRPMFHVASVTPCLRLTTLHCLHAPEADVSGAWSSCAAACLPHGIVINRSIGHRCPASALPPPSLPVPRPHPCAIPSIPCLCEWACACPVSGAGGEHGRERWPPLCVSCTSECPVSAVGGSHRLPSPTALLQPRLGPGTIWALGPHPQGTAWGLGCLSLLCCSSHPYKEGRKPDLTGWTWGSPW